MEQLWEGVKSTLLDCNIPEENILEEVSLSAFQLCVIERTLFVPGSGGHVSPLLQHPHSPASPPAKHMNNAQVNEQGLSSYNGSGPLFTLFNQFGYI